MFHSRLSECLALAILILYFSRFTMIRLGSTIRSRIWGMITWVYTVVIVMLCLSIAVTLIKAGDLVWVALTVTVTGVYVIASQMFFRWESLQLRPGMLNQLDWRILSVLNHSEPQAVGQITNRVNTLLRSDGDTSEIWRDDVYTNIKNLISMGLVEKRGMRDVDVPSPYLTTERKLRETYAISPEGEKFMVLGPDTMRSDRQRFTDWFQRQSFLATQRRKQQLV